MGDVNVKPSDRAKYVGKIDPDAHAAGAVSSAWINAANAHNYLATVQTGVLGTDATIDAKLEQATTSGGAGAKDITGKAITQLTDIDSPNDASKVAQINLATEELDVEGGFDFFRLTVTVAVATSDVSALVQQFDRRYQPGADSSDVAEVVT